MKKLAALFGGLCLCTLLTACGGGSEATDAINELTGGNNEENPPAAAAQVWLPEQLEVVTNESN